MIRVKFWWLVVIIDIVVTIFHDQAKSNSRWKMGSIDAVRIALENGWPCVKTKASSINKGKWKQHAATIRKYECQTLPERSTKTRRGCKIISFRGASIEREVYILSTGRDNFDFRIINFPFANTNFHKKSYQRITSIFHRISVEIIGKVLIKWPSITKVVKESR